MDGYVGLLISAVVFGLIIAIISFQSNKADNQIDDGAKEIQRFVGSAMLGGSSIEELILTDSYALSRRYESSSYVKRKIYYSDIAQISIKKGLVGCELHIVDRGGGPFVGIKGLDRESADEAQRILHGFKTTPKPGEVPINNSRLDALERLAQLKREGALSESEFQQEKSRIMNQ